MRGTWSRQLGKGGEYSLAIQALAIKALAILRRLHEGIGLQEPSENGVINAPVHVNDAPKFQWLFRIGPQLFH